MHSFTAIFAHILHICYILEILFVMLGTEQFKIQSNCRVNLNTFHLQQLNLAVVKLNFRFLISFSRSEKISCIDHVRNLIQNLFNIRDARGKLSHSIC